jgi:hypothetical protein
MINPYISKLCFVLYTYYATFCGGGGGGQEHKHLKVTCITSETGNFGIRFFFFLLYTLTKRRTLCLCLIN